LSAVDSDAVTSLTEGARPDKSAAGTWVEHRSAGIDILRGLCALLVVLHHIHLRFKINHFDVSALLPMPIARVLFGSGHFSVITFFVISGFLITTLSLRRWTSLERIDWRQFYWLRFTRIAPCMLALIALLAVLHLAQAPGFVINPERATLGRAVLAALTFHVNWLEGHHGYLPGPWDILWSLSVEELFYLLFPVTCLLIRGERWLLCPLLALILIGPFYRASIYGQDPWDEYAYFSCMDGIAFGVLAALFTTRYPLRRNASRWIMALGLSGVLFIVVFKGLPASSALHPLGLGITVLEISVALILIALSRGIGATLLTRGTGFILMVGRSSYEIYLTHMLVLMAPMPFIVTWQPDRATIPLIYIAMLALSIALGWIVNRAFSEPLNQALRAR